MLGADGFGGQLGGVLKLSWEPTSFSLRGVGVVAFLGRVSVRFFSRFRLFDPSSLGFVAVCDGLLLVLLESSAWHFPH